MGNRNLVDRALKKAEEYEKQGNTLLAKKWFKFAEKCDKIYDKHERTKNA